MINDDMFGSLSSISKTLAKLDSVSNIDIPNLNTLGALTMPITSMKGWGAIQPINTMLQSLTSKMLSNEWLEDYNNQTSFLKPLTSLYNFNPVNEALQKGIIHSLASTKLNYANEFGVNSIIKDLASSHTAMQTHFKYTSVNDLLSNIGKMSNSFTEKSNALKILSASFVPPNPNIMTFSDTIKIYQENSKLFKENLYRFKVYSEQNRLEPEVETIVSEFVANADTIQIENDNLETAVFNNFMQVLNSLFEEFFNNNLSLEKIKLLLLSPSMIFLTYTSSILSLVKSTPKKGRKDIEVSLFEKCDALTTENKLLKVRPDNRYKVLIEILKGEKISVIEIGENNKWVRVRILKNGETFDAWTLNKNLKKI